MSFTLGNAFAFVVGKSKRALGPNPGDDHGGQELRALGPKSGDDPNCVLCT